MKNYKRLTERTKHGIAVLDSGERFVLSCGGYATAKALNRLAELEDKIENGTLVEFPFCVFDKKKNKEADCYKIALKEDWAKCLCYCDMEGFAITQDGMLILLDECGRYTYCPDNRFKVVAETRLKELQEN